MLILNVVPGVYYSCSFSHIELLISPSGKPLDNGWNTGDIFGHLPSTLPSLENLVLILWRLLSGQGLVEILNDIEQIQGQYQRIRFIWFCHYRGWSRRRSKLSSCRNLTAGGLKEILRLSGNKLRVLDVSYADKTFLLFCP